MNQYKLNTVSIKNMGTILQDIYDLASSSDNHTWFIENNEFQEYSKEDWVRFLHDLSTLKSIREDLYEIIECYGSTVEEIERSSLEEKSDCLVTFYGDFLQLFQGNSKILQIKSFEQLTTILGQEKYNQLMGDIIEQYACNNEIRYYWFPDEMESLTDSVAMTLAKHDVSLFTNKNTIECFDALYDCLIEDSWVFEWQNEVENEMFHKFIESVEQELQSKCGTHVTLDLDITEFSEILYNQDIVFNSGLYDQMKNVELNINVPIEMPQEWNSDYGNTMDLIRDMMNVDGLDEAYIDSYKDAGLLWLIEQQGYRLEDVFMNQMLPETEQNGFLNSVFSEICGANTGYSQMKLYVLLKVDLPTYCSLVSNENHPFKIHFATNHQGIGNLGLYNPYLGTGSMLEIFPEKDVVVPKDMIGHIQVEGQHVSREYTINECYGLIDSCWKQASLTLTNEEVFHDVTLDIQKVNSEIDKYFKILEAEDYSDYDD